MAGESPNHGVTNSVVELLAGILKDTQKLMWQELRLAKHELHHEIRKTLTTLLTLAVGIALALIGALLLIFMLVYLTNALTELPLWVCYGIIAGIFAGIGVILMIFGMKGFKNIHIIPVQTIETVKENVRWFKEIATSSRI